MKIALFESINETHVCDALDTALRLLGHEVETIGSGWRKHWPATGTPEKHKTDEAVDQVIDARCDALFNFRASALGKSQLERLRGAGIRTAVWLPDDPVLYRMTYRQVVNFYDLVLHCGSAPVLEFYDSKGHPPGVNFPFWLDPRRWSYSYDFSRARRALVFLGNLVGPAKRGRYGMLKDIASHVSIYGRVNEDPLSLHRAELYGVDAMAAVLPGFQAGLDIPQRFADYEGSEYEYPELSGLGGFDLPSRVLQYAAVGLPVISISGQVSNPHFAPVMAVTGVGEVLPCLAQLKADPEFAMQKSRDGRTELERHFSGTARARFLVSLLSGAASPAKMSLRERELAYREHDGRTA